MRPAAALLGLLLAGCGELRAPCDYDDGGVCIAVRSERPWSSREDLRPRMHHLVAASLDYWGAPWSALEGWAIEVQDPMIDGWSVGRTYMREREILVSTEWARDCVEQLPIPHEIGHALIYDPGHTDPRWDGFAPLADEMTAYARDLGDTACIVFPLMW